MLVYQAKTAEDSPLCVVYSGDTIVDPSALEFDGVAVASGSRQ